MASPRETIAARWPNVLRRLDQAAPVTDLELDESGSVPTLRACGLRLASAWDPEAEARLQCSHLPENCKAVTVFGVGMGYLPQLAVDRLPRDGTVEVVVLNAGLLKILLDVLGDWRWLEHPAVELKLPEECPALPAHWVVTPALLRCVDPPAEPLRDWIEQALDADYTRKWLDGREALVGRNMAANLPMLERDTSVGVLLERASAIAREIVVAGAGPTLDESIERIRELRERGATVVSVDAAFASLMHAGVVPDFVISLDPHETVLSFYQLDLAPARATTLVYFPCVHPSVIERWPYRRCYAYTRHERFDALRRRFPATTLYASGSVIHPAVDLAVRLGASRVHLAGADFGYPGGLSHAKDSFHARSVSGNVAGNGSSVRDYRGERVSSQPSFVSYYRDLEAYILHDARAGSCRFVSLSARSACLRGVQVDRQAA